MALMSPTGRHPALLGELENFDFADPSMLPSDEDDDGFSD